VSEPPLFQRRHIDGDVEPESGVVPPVRRERLAEKLKRITRLPVGGDKLAKEGS
jgi:hypothetical protein